MIRDDIKAATIAAMKGGDKETTATLRLASAAIKNRDIEARTGDAPKDDNVLVTEVLQKMVKQRREVGGGLPQGRPRGSRRCRGGRDHNHRALPPEAARRRRRRGRDRRNHRRGRRQLDEGHGPGNGAGEGTTRRFDRTCPGERSGEGGALLRYFEREKGPAARKRRSPIGSKRLFRRYGCRPGACGTHDARHALHHEMVKVDGDRTGERTGNADLKVAGQSGELGADCRDVPSAAPTAGNAITVAAARTILSFGIVMPGEQAEYYKHQRHIHHADGNEAR